MKKCIGCDREIDWDGIGMFSYTCPCGATIFYDEETEHLFFPLLLARSLQLGSSLPHLNDLVGGSNNTSPIKEQLVKELREKGFIWIEECEQCRKDGTLKSRQEWETYLILEEAEAIIKYGNTPL